MNIISVKMMVLHRVKQRALLICTALEQVDSFKLLNLSLAFALHRSVKLKALI